MNGGAKEGRVVLVHGLWMRGLALIVLRRRLQREGFSVETFDYASVFHDPDAVVERLLRRVQLCKSKEIHFVGHSLGGLMVLRALRKQPDLIDGRVVCLGSPLQGSAAARGLAAWPGGRFVVGRNLPILSAGVERWTGRQAVGVVAGSLPYGLGFAFGTLASPHDGTVSVAETRLEGLADHCVVAATHTGLLFSSEAAAQTAAFLRDGRFRGDATARRTSAA